MVRVTHVTINGDTPPGLPAVTTLAGLAVFCCVFAAGVGPVRSQDAPAGPLARAEAFALGLASFTAELRQRYHDRLHDRDVDSTGVLVLSRPDRLLVRFEGGRGLLLVGTSVLAYDPDVGEDGLVHERTLDDDELPELRALLAGTSTLADTFDVRELGPSSSGDVIELRPRTRIGWDRALVAVGPDGVPARLLVVDEAGNTLRWVIERPRASRSLPPGTLALPIPDRAPRIAP